MDTISYGVQEVSVDGSCIRPERFDSLSAAYNFGTEIMGQASELLHHVQVIRYWGRRMDRVDTVCREHSTTLSGSVHPF